MILSRKIKGNWILIIFVCLSIIISSCGTTKRDNYPIRVDIRYGYKFFSLRANALGEAYVIKGKGSYFTELLKIANSDTSLIFKLDSIESFSKEIAHLRNNPNIREHVNTDSPRGEIYYENYKILDEAQTSGKFIDVFRPIITQLPSGFNPFLLDEHPFE